VSVDEPSLGADIAAARRAVGVSVVEVSNRTRIRASVIESMEAGDFSHCGGDVYARGHLRAIASAVGADPKPWVSSYDQQFGTVAPSATEVLEADLASAPRRRGANWSAVMVLALIIVVVFVVAQNMSSSDSPGHNTNIVAGPNATPSPTPTKTSQPSEAPTQIAKGDPQEVVVRVTALPNGISWVQVSRPDGSVVFTGNIGGGQSKTFRDDKRLDLVVGDAAGVQLTVNGQDLGSPGGSGEVARLSFTPKDPAGAAG
jgi:cytoskeletal protein RodZ